MLLCHMAFLWMKLQLTLIPSWPHVALPLRASLFFLWLHTFQHNNVRISPAGEWAFFGIHFWKRFITQGANGHLPTRQVIIQLFILAITYNKGLEEYPLRYIWTLEKEKWGKVWLWKKMLSHQALFYLFKAPIPDPFLIVVLFSSDFSS